MVCELYHNKVVIKMKKLKGVIKTNTKVTNVTHGTAKSLASYFKCVRIHH